MYLLRFSLADKEYAVNIDSVREVRRIKNVTPIPQALDFIEGVVSLRGRVIPIISLRKKLRLPPAEKKDLNRVLITESNDHILGIAVDNVIGVTAIDESNIEKPDDVLNKAQYLIGVAKFGKQLILIVDMDKLLSGEDRTSLQEVHKKVELRKKAR